jgi:hypothetical protein
MSNTTTLLSRLLGALLIGVVTLLLSLSPAITAPAAAAVASDDTGRVTWLELFVYDAVTEKPIAGAAVRVLPLSGERSLYQHGMTNAYGSYITAVEPTAYEVRVRADGYRELSLGVIEFKQGVSLTFKAPLTARTK